MNQQLGLTVKHVSPEGRVTYTESAIVQYCPNGKRVGVKIGASDERIEFTDGLIYLLNSAGKTIDRISLQA